MKIAYLFLLAFMLLSCSEFKNENNELTYRWENVSLVLENGSSEPIYYAVFEQENLAHINWAAVSTEENQILPNTFISISATDIYNYNEGDTVVLFYWTGTEPPFEDLETIEIET